MQRIYQEKKSRKTRRDYEIDIQYKKKVDVEKIKKDIKELVEQVDEALE